MTPLDGNDLVDAGQTGLVRHTYGYFSAHQSPDGSLVHSGPKRGEGYQYTAPDGTAYQRNWSYHEDGSPTGIIGHGVTGPVVNGKQVVALTIINRVDHTYSQTRTEYAVTGDADPAESPTLSLASSPSEVQQALRSGQVPRLGTTRIDGTPVTALSIALPLPDAESIHLTLYVDARTHQPLRTVTVVDGNPGPYVADRIPATPGNIAKATDDSIPAGYTQVDRAG
ncbi:MAG TPA: hypothetical protein VGJ19_01530 [Streptosporangiaceae bacterium]